MEAIEEDGESPVSTRFILTSSERCKSRYTLKLEDFHPPVRIISERVEPDVRMALAAPRLKQWDE